MIIPEIGKIIYDFFQQSPIMPIGLFFIFAIDSFFPTLPQIFALLLFMPNPTIEWGLVILGIVVAGEITGNTLLYALVSSAKVPSFIETTMKNYVHFLIFEDEKIIIVNRFAPVIPFMGAFIATCNWNYKKAMFYTAISGLAYYALLLTFSGISYAYLNRDLANKVTIFLIFFVISLSFISSRIRKKKLSTE
jgi:hypothetical protein